MQQTFLEKAPTVSDEKIDELERMLKSKMEMKTGYADAHTLSRQFTNAMKSLDLSDDGKFTKQSFRNIMVKMNCGDDFAVVDGLFARYDRKGDGKFAMKDFAEALFGIKPVANSNPECRDVIKLVRNKILERGENGYRGLVRVLRIMDDNGNKMLDKQELKSGLQTYGINLNAMELDTLMHFFDTDKNGAIDVTEFMVGLRPTMSESRLALVKLAFLRLDKNPDGQITYDELRSVYKVDKHPAVIKGTKTPQQVLEEFSAAWNKNGDNVITEQEFIDYYKDISATIDNDAYFELMIRNAWHIAGGKGAAANTSNLRVLVTHLDGSQCVETIENDLGLDSDDKNALVAALRKQGVTDILKVETTF